MEFKRYEDINEFIKDNMELILKKEWLNNLMVSIAEYCSSLNGLTTMSLLHNLIKDLYLDNAFLNLLNFNADLSA